MTPREYVLYLWAGSWLAFTWGSFFVVVAHRAYRRRVYRLQRCRIPSS